MVGERLGRCVRHDGWSPAVRASFLSIVHPQERGPIQVFFKKAKNARGSRRASTRRFPSLRATTRTAAGPSPLRLSRFGWFGYTPPWLCLGSFDAGAALSGAGGDDARTACSASKWDRLGQKGLTQEYIMMIHAEVLPTYRRFRQIGLQLNHKLVKTLSKEALHEGGRGWAFSRTEYSSSTRKMRRPS